MKVRYEKRKIIRKMKHKKKVLNMKKKTISKIFKVNISTEMQSTKMTSEIMTKDRNGK